jgi:plasmid stabilization system protein ParE
MAFEIVWTKRASNGYDKIVKYLEENWTGREARNFISDSDKSFETLRTHPEILQKTDWLKNVRRCPINALIISHRQYPILYTCLLI